jgi:hypothetical protein
MNKTTRSTRHEPQEWWPISEDRDDGAVQLHGSFQKTYYGTGPLSKKTTLEAIAYLGQVFLRPSRSSALVALVNSQGRW